MAATLIANEGDTVCFLRFDNRPSASDVRSYMEQVELQPASYYDLIHTEGGYDPDLDNSTIVLLGSTRSEGREVAILLRGIQLWYQIAWFDIRGWNSDHIFAAVRK